MIDYDKFRQALRHLEEQFGHLQTLDSALPTWMQEAVKESVIQRFETCFDCLWKVVKRYLAEEIGLPELEKTGPKPLFRLANENNLLRGKVERWLEYTDLRNNTSHDYSGEKAKAALAGMQEFVSDAIALFQTLTGETWK